MGPFVGPLLTTVPVILPGLTGTLETSDTGDDVTLGLIGGWIDTSGCANGETTGILEVGNATGPLETPIGELIGGWIDTSGCANGETTGILDVVNATGLFETPIGSRFTGEANGETTGILEVGNAIGPLETPIGGRFTGEAKGDLETKIGALEGNELGTWGFNDAKGPCSKGMEVFDGVTDTLGGGAGEFDGKETTSGSREGTAVLVERVMGDGLVEGEAKTKPGLCTDEPDGLGVKEDVNVGFTGKFKDALGDADI
eukprot:CFRG1366T1